MWIQWRWRCKSRWRWVEGSKMHCYIAVVKCSWHWCYYLHNSRGLLVFCSGNFFCKIMTNGTNCSNTCVEFAIFRNIPIADFDCNWDHGEPLMCIVSNSIANKQKIQILGNSQLLNSICKFICIFQIWPPNAGLKQILIL